MEMRYQKITIEVANQEHTRIEAMFNPAEYAISQDVTYEDVKDGRIAFKSEQYQPLQLSLFFDTFDTKKDVRLTYTEKIAKLTHPIENSGTDGKQPPVCVVVWGSLSFQGRVQKVEQKFTLFLQDGTPVRATVALTVVPLMKIMQVESNKGLDNCRKLWTVKSGDRLDLIAYRMLADSAKWRRIAEANQIIDPLRFPTREDIGRVIVIPD